jgi:hypothetical protein
VTGAAKADIEAERNIGNGKDVGDLTQQSMKTIISCLGNIFALDGQPFNGRPHYI